MRWMLMAACFLAACGPDTELPVDMTEWNCATETARKLVVVTFNDCWTREDVVYNGSGIGDHSGCLEYALNLWCKRAESVAPPSATIPDLRSDLNICEERLHACKVVDDQDCAEAKADQQELRFWKRCGVIRPGDHDQRAECDGMEGAADAACSPLYHTEVDPEWCSGGNRELWDRMQRDGVSWINCKDGEVCP